MTSPPPETSITAAAARRWDVIVAGGGPAGTTAAAQLAAEGHAVLLVEQHRYPRDKACGDALIPDALRVLDTLGLGDMVRRAGHRVRTARIYSPSRIHFDLPGDFVTIPRLRLDAMLAAHAVERGAALLTGRVTSLAPDGAGGVVARLKGTDATLEARIGMIATGADAALLPARRGAAERRPSAVAMRVYVRSRHRIDELIISFDQSIIPGYAWIFPLGDGEYNIGCGIFYGRRGKPAVNLRTMLARFLAEFPPARALMAAGTPAQALDGARLRCGLDLAPLGPAQSQRPIVAVGETIGSTFPFTGEGVGKAMETASLAARHVGAALAADDLAALGGFAGAIDVELRPKYRGYAVAQAWLSHAWLSDLVARRIVRSARLRDHLAGILNETVDPRRVFSLRALLPSLAR